MFRCNFDLPRKTMNSVIFVKFHRKNNDKIEKSNICLKHDAKNVIIKQNLAVICFYLSFRPFMQSTDTA